MALFQFSGVRGRGLQLVYKYLLSISAASIEAAAAEALYAGLQKFTPRWQLFKRLVCFFLRLFYRYSKGCMSCHIILKF